MNYALILSGGRGTRLGSDTPKQYLKVQNKMIISYCLDTIFASSYIDRVQIVAEEEWRTVILDYMKENRQLETFAGFSAPGENRQLSIFHGLQDILSSRSGISDTKDNIMIHDAARPSMDEAMISAGFHALEDHDGAMPVLPMKDTVYLAENGKIASLLDRSHVVAGQAPEFFRLASYFAANQALMPEKIKRINGSTEPAVLAGLNVAVIDGDEKNFKITTKADLERFERERSAPLAIQNFNAGRIKQNECLDTTWNT